MTMLLKVLVMLEGGGRRLAPNFSMVEVLKPYRAKMLARRLSPSRQFRKARRIAYEIEQLAEVFPRRLRDILQQVQAGRFDVHLDHRGLEPSRQPAGAGHAHQRAVSGLGADGHQQRAAAGLLAAGRRLGAGPVGRLAERGPRAAAAPRHQQERPPRPAAVTGGRFHRA